MSVESVEAEEFARRCAVAMSEKKAEDIVVIDLRGISSFTDFFVIGSGSSEPQLKAIGSAVREVSRAECGRSPRNEDGFPAAQWVAVDFGDVVAHVFQHEKRLFYNLEALWKDAPRLDWEKGN